MSGSRRESGGKGESMKACLRIIAVFASSLLALGKVQAQAPGVQWAKTLPGSGSWSVHETADQGYVVTGDLYAGGKLSLYLVRTDHSGDTLWTRAIGSDVYAGGRSGMECSDGSFIATGHLGLDVLVAKTSPDGVPLWAKTFYGFIPGYINRSYCVRETSEGGYIVCGYSGVFGSGANALIIKLAQNGDQEFLHTYGEVRYEEANAIVQTSDGGYLAVGSSRPVSTVESQDRFWILKINGAGGQEWIRTYGGPNTDILTSICPAGDGGYLAAGYTNSSGAGNFDFFLMKLSSSGDSLWARTYGSANTERCYSITPAGTDKFVLAGMRTGDVQKAMTVCVDANGDERWTKLAPDGGSPYFAGHGVDATADGGCIVTGTTGTTGTYLVKLASFVTAVDDYARNGLPAGYELRQNMPNPFDPSTTIRFSIVRPEPTTLLVFDASGRRVATLVNDVLEPGTYTVRFDGSSCASGVYFYRLTTGSYAETKKMLLLQ